MGAIFRDKKKLVKYNKYSILYQWNKYNAGTQTVGVLGEETSLSSNYGMACDGSNDEYYSGRIEIRYATSIIAHSNGKAIGTNRSKIITLLDEYYTLNSSSNNGDLLYTVNVPANVYLLPYWMASDYENQWDGYNGSKNNTYIYEEAYNSGTHRNITTILRTNVAQTLEVRAFVYPASNTYSARMYGTAAANNRITGYYPTVSAGTKYYRSSKIGIVTSSNRETYPDCGVSNNYWYDYLGITKGDYIETIQTNKGAYPNGGIQDGYYYELIS